MITAALVGNPNVGKTTIFNLLTGSKQYVGNWAGVTVDSKEGYLDKSIKIVDLPGIYAMDTYSNEEKVSKNFLTDANVDLIINIVDASNLDRNLYLTMQLLKFKKPIVLVVNMVNIAQAKGISIDCKKLSERLNLKVIPIMSLKGKGIGELKRLLKNGNFFSCVNDNEYQYADEKEVYGYIEGVLEQCLKKTSENIITKSEKIDRIVLNKYLAYPVFIGILWLIFQFTFSWVGQPLAHILDSGVNEWLVPRLNIMMESNSPWFRSMLVDGVVSGVGAVIVFLPVILTLFLGISFLEDSGYMARAAFIMDKLMRRMGLSGKAFIPLIIGFGCSVPGIMSARTLESEKDRKLTALLVPLMSCNARLPVYALFASAFFKGREASVVASLYIFGILMAFLAAIVLKRTVFKKAEEPFIIELPEYKMPGFTSLMIHTWEKGKGFVKKAGTVIFSAAIFVWFLSNFNFSGMVEMNSSFLAYIGEAITPVFEPLGFASWQNTVALLTGIIAKEVVIGTMGVVYGGDLATALPTLFSPISAYSFLVFVLLYTPCISVVATMKKEYGNKMAVFSVTYQLFIAWIASFAVYNIGGLIIRLF